MKKILIPLLLIVLSFSFISCKKQNTQTTEENTILVCFDANNGNEIASEEIKPSDFSSFKLPVVTKEGFVFEGWYSDSELTKQVLTLSNDLVIEGKINLYAKWAKEIDYLVINNNGTFNYTYYEDNKNISYELNVSLNQFNINDINSFKMYLGLYLRGDLEYDFDIAILNGKIYLRGPVEVITMISELKNTILGTMTGYAKISLDLNRIFDAIKSVYDIDLLEILKAINIDTEQTFDEFLNKLREDIKGFLNKFNVLHLKAEDVDSLFAFLDAIIDNFTYEKTEDGFKLTISNENLGTVIDDVLEIIKLLAPSLLYAYNNISSMIPSTAPKEVLVDDYYIPVDLPYFFNKNHEIIYYSEEYLFLGEVDNQIFLPTNNISYAFIMNNNFSPFSYRYIDTDINGNKVYIGSDNYNVLLNDGSLISVSEYITNYIKLDPISIKGSNYYMFYNYLYDNEFKLIEAPESYYLLTEYMFNSDELKDVVANIKLNKFELNHKNEEDKMENGLSLDFSISNYFSFNITNSFNFEETKEISQSFNTKSVLDITNIIIKMLTK